ncbi:MAG TPA: DUF1697 domain-containing protein [Telluria sp.]|nr:DUF1697 domain-containing protein [Telluria sp.]
MTTRSYVALLRGINVGRAKRIAMADLRQLVAELGFDDVRSLLNSGNVVFRGAGRQQAIGASIEEALVLKLGVPSRVTVLDAAEFGEVVDDNPLVEVADEASRLFAFILARPADRVLVEPLAAMQWGPEQVAVGRRAAYVWCPVGLLQSPAATAVGKALGDATTSRNWATIGKLHAMLRA